MCHVAHVSCRDATGNEGVRRLPMPRARQTIDPSNPTYGTSEFLIFEENFVLRVHPQSGSKH